MHASRSVNQAKAVQGILAQHSSDALTRSMRGRPVDAGLEGVAHALGLELEPPAELLLAARKEQTFHHPIMMAGH